VDRQRRDSHTRKSPQAVTRGAPRSQNIMSYHDADRSSTVPNEYLEPPAYVDSRTGEVSLLDNATQTVNQRGLALFRGFWALSTHDGCGEGSVFWRNPPAVPDRGIRGAGGARAALEADRRARAEVRRYCTKNGLDRLLTLTYRPDDLPDDLGGVWKDIERFRRRLFAITGKIPLVCVVEQGEQSGRLHVHVAVGQYLDRAMVAEAWSRGFIDIRKIKAGGSGKRERCRRAAGYISKYVTKDGGTELREFNGHRYSTTNGFKNARRSFEVASLAEGTAQLLRIHGGEIEFMWSSAMAEDWMGPPVISFRFSDP